MQPLTPSFSAGTSNPNAGQLSPLTVTFAREDEQQDISQVSVKHRRGCWGWLDGMPLCGEPQANAGTCRKLPYRENDGRRRAGWHPF